MCGVLNRWLPEQQSPAVCWRGSPWWLLAYAVIAAFLMFGWWGSGPLRPTWDHLDQIVFETLNGGMAERRGVRLIWAVTNSRYFDIVTGLAILVCYAAYLCGDNRRKFNGRLWFGAVMAGFMFLWMHEVMKLLLDHGRLSPTLVLPEVVRIGEEFDFIPLVKDFSRDSFPGDHFGIALMIALILFHVAGRRVGLWMLVIATLSVFPRMAGGAHWLSDQLVGGGFAGLTGATCFLLPVWWWSRRLAEPETTADS